MICLEIGHICLIGVCGLDLLKGLLILPHFTKGDYSGVYEDELRDSATTERKLCILLAVVEADRRHVISASHLLCRLEQTDPVPLPHVPIVIL